MAITWNENLSNELKKLNTMRNPSVQQKNRIAALKGIKQSSGGVVRGGPVVQDPSKADPKVQDPGTVGAGDTAVTIDNFLDGVFGNFKPLDLSGAPKILGQDDLAADRTKVYDVSYAEATKNLDRDQARALEEQKQELANRGIVYDPARADSLYSKTVGSVNERFDANRTSAANNARLAADASAQTAQGLSKTVRDTYTQDAISQYQSQLEAGTTGAGVLQALMQKYGLDQATAQEILNRKSAEKLAREANAAKNRGSGSSGSSGTTRAPAASAGFEIL